MLCFGGIALKILVDADACPVKNIIERTAKKFGIPVVMFIDSSHILSSEYSEIVTVGQGKDAVDIALINRAEPGDIVVTQDYGVAALALGKGAYAVNNFGTVFSDKNIDQMLFERHISAKIRRSGGRLCGFHKRTKKNDEQFEQSLVRLIEKLLNTGKGADQH